ncbi:chemotaxis protein CheW [Nitrospira sp. Kam-Ns4a]
MGKTLRGLKSETPAAPKTCAVVLFSVGGRRLATRVEEVGGVRPWAEAMPVPSDTPYVNALLRYGEEVLPVYDLAARLGVQVEGEASLCLVARHRRGPLALRIDPDLPTIHAVELAAVRPAASPDPDCLGVCPIGGQDVLLYSLAALGEAG